MELNKIIIALISVIIILLLCFIGFTLYNQYNIEYETIAISNATTIDVPVSNEAQLLKDDLGILYYQDNKYDVSIISWNSQEELSITGAVDVTAQFEKQKGGNTPEIVDGVPVFYNKETGYYCIETGNDTTHDNILIMCKNRDIALKIYHSIKYGVSDVEIEQNTVPVSNVNKNNKSSESDDNDELKYGGYSKEEYYYKMGLAEGHGLWNDYESESYSSVSTSSDYAPSSDSSSSSNVETTVG